MEKCSEMFLLQSDYISKPAGITQEHRYGRNRNRTGLACPLRLLMILAPIAVGSPIFRLPMVTPAFVMAATMSASPMAPRQG